MTIIQKLKLHGFKSFAKPTEIELGQDFNIILGPNGSGKTNIVDAICFVLGKLSTKSLRAERSSNLIYNGGKKHTPSKYAKVSIHFDNSKKTFPIDSKEVVISRTVKQSGNSVYRINEEVRTRQQMLDLLSSAKINPDGHNIILQGDIVKFAEMKPDERRQIVEEIAGISVYEDKKNKAMHELEKVQGKLTEIEIILKEREANLRELKKDRDQAKKYKELQGKIKENKATFINIQIKGKESKKDELEKRFNELNKKIESNKKKIEELRTDISQKREEIKNINSEIEEKGEKDQLVLRKDIEDLKTSVIKHDSRIETLNNEIKKIEERKAQLKNDSVDTEKNISDLKNNKKQLDLEIKNLSSEENALTKQIDALKKKYGIKDLGEYREKLDEIERKIEGSQNSIYKLHEQKQEIIREKDKSEFLIKDIEEKINKIKNLKEENKAKVNELQKTRQEFKKVTQELSKSLNEDSAYSAQLQKTRRELVTNNEELAVLRAKNLGIREHLSQDRAVNKILSLKDKKIHGCISSLGQVPSKYSLALEVSAGARLKSVVVEDDNVAANCIKILKENKLGIATFLPLNKIRPKGETKISSAIKGVLGLAIDLIKFNPKYKNVFSYVFGSTLVVENIETARKIGIGRIRMVTLDGTLLETSGAMIGGYRINKGIGFSQKEITKRISELDQVTIRLTSIIRNLEDKKLNGEEKNSELRERKAILEGGIITLEKVLGIKEDSPELKDDKDNLIKKDKEFVNQLKEIESQLKNLEKEQENSKKIKLSLTTKITQKPDASKDLSDLENKKSELRDKIYNIRAEINTMDNQIEKIFLPEIEKTDKIIRDIEKEKEAFSNELTDLSEILKNKKLELKTNERKEKEFYGKFRNLASKRNSLQDNIQKKESFILVEEQKTKSVEERIHDISINKAKIVAELEALQLQFEEVKDAKIRRNTPLDELKSEIREFEKMVNNLGNVNLRALEIYEDLEKEHQKLSEKVSKLKLEKEDVLAMIQEIEDKKKDSFMVTFKQIAGSFKNIFNSLSTKGEAFLDLEDKENPLSAGIDIKVRIVGNKFLDIRSLSGGEKTLTALALIFSIQEFDPASFYLLDEVDAALDKHNSEKLSTLINKYSEKAQYIVISHNDTVITEANQVYGISMQNGVSKVVSLKV